MPDIGIPVSGFLRSKFSLMKMDEEKRSAFAKRLKDLALHMYDAMSQGQHNTIFVTQEMADDV